MEQQTPQNGVNRDSADSNPKRGARAASQKRKKSKIQDKEMRRSGTLGGGRHLQGWGQGDNAISWMARGFGICRARRLGGGGGEMKIDVFLKNMLQ